MNTRQAHHQEKVILTRNRSRISLINYYFLFLLFVFFGIYSFRKNIVVFPFVFLVIGIISIIISEKKVHYTKLTITSHRAIYKEGILKRHVRTIRYASITDISSKQSFIQRILNYGDLAIITSGAKKEYEIVIEKIRDPEKTRSIIEKFVLSSRHHL